MGVAAVMVLLPFDIKLFILPLYFSKVALLLHKVPYGDVGDIVKVSILLVSPPSMNAGDSGSSLGFL